MGRELSERVEQIDNATYFACGVGGSGELPLLFGLLKSGPTPLQAEACNVLKVILQNNPKCQEKALKIGGMNALILVTQTHPEMKMRVRHSPVCRHFYDMATRSPSLLLPMPGDLRSASCPH